MKIYSSVDAYILDQPSHAKPFLKVLRQTVKKAAPDAVEGIGYGMPSYKQHGVLVYFAAFKEHYSFFPASAAIRLFRERLKAYETSTGTIRFSYKKKVPVKLITSIVKYRVKENIAKHVLKLKKKK